MASHTCMFYKDSGARIRVASAGFGSPSGALLHSSHPKCRMALGRSGHAVGKDRGPDRRRRFVSLLRHGVGVVRLAHHLDGRTSSGQGPDNSPHTATPTYRVEVVEGGGCVPRYPSFCLAMRVCRIPVIHTTIDTISSQ